MSLSFLTNEVAMLIKSSENLWIHHLNQLGAAGKSAFLLMDFEQKQPLLWSEEEWTQDDDLQFSFLEQQGASVDKDYVYPGDLLCGSDYATPESYKTAFDIVQSGLQRGDSFLTNLTMPTEVELSASIADVYRLAAAPYRVCLKDKFVSFSPETFVKIDANGLISSNPMKGTAEDSPEGRHHLLSSQKEIAEHATIVDLIRNDLSQVAKKVSVTDYRYIDRIQTPRGGLLQTSTKITGQLPENWKDNLGTIISRLLPAGSVSGAPKPATLDIIRRAEGRKRGYYCGIGLYFDGKSVDSCVLIRFIEKTTEGKHLFWAGGGITAQSSWQEEYAELKAKVRIPLRPA